MHFFVAVESFNHAHRRIIPNFTRPLRADYQQRWRPLPPFLNRCIFFARSRAADLTRSSHFRSRGRSRETRSRATWSTRRLIMWSRNAYLLNPPIDQTSRALSRHTPPHHKSAVLPPLAFIVRQSSQPTRPIAETFSRDVRNSNYISV